MTTLLLLMEQLDKKIVPMLELDGEYFNKRCELLRRLCSYLADHFLVLLTKGSKYCQPHLCSVPLLYASTYCMAATVDGQVAPRRKSYTDCPRCYEGSKPIGMRAWKDMRGAYLHLLQQGQYRTFNFSGADSAIGGW